MTCLVELEAVAQCLVPRKLWYSRGSWIVVREDCFVALLGCMKKIWEQNISLLQWYFPPRGLSGYQRTIGETLTYGSVITTLLDLQLFRGHREHYANLCERVAICFRLFNDGVVYASLLFLFYLVNLIMHMKFTSPAVSMMSRARYCPSSVMWCRYVISIKLNKNGDEN